MNVCNITLCKNTDSSRRHEIRI